MKRSITPALRSAAARPLVLRVLPVALCLVILWQTLQLYGSCRQPSRATSVQALQQYLLHTSQAVRRRNATTADAMEKLAAEISGAAPRAAQLQQQLADAQASCEATKKQEAQLKQQLSSMQQQLASSKKEALQKQQPEVTDADAEAQGLRLLELAGLQCNAVRDQEFWADPLSWGGEHRAKSAAECCAACHAYTAAVERGGTEKGRNGTRCNVWAFCADREACKERHGECWIKHEGKPLPPPPALPTDPHPIKGWVSGAVYPNDAHLQQHENTSLVLHTSLGDIHIKLLPELAPASVRELRRSAGLHTAAAGGCSNCRIYRPEPNFLVQGVFEAAGLYVAVPRHPSPQQPMVMPRGMVCWAGGSGGPHWFVNLIRQDGFKDEHLCWGQVVDMTLLDKIVTLPKREKKPGEMNELVDHIKYTISLKPVDTTH